MASLNTARRFLIAFGLLLPWAAPAESGQNAAQNTSLTAALSPAGPTVGVTKVTIAGTSSAGASVIDTSTFPDGSVHRFSLKADPTGAYTDGPFVLQQLGTYHDVLRDDATGASAAVSYSGVGDFSVAVDPAGQPVMAGAEATFTVTFKSVSGFGGQVLPLALNLSKIRGATASWSTSSVRVPPNGSASATLTILTLIGTPARTYKIILQGTNGSVTHVVKPAISLKVTGPKPNTITAALHPANPTAGVTQVLIRGRATAGEWVTDTSTFPDGSSHKFSIKATGAGTYTDGPFVLKQLGTYHDVLLDGATGATAEITYHAAGDFGAAIDHAGQTVAKGQEAKFLVTFKSLSGFAGTIVPAAPNLSEIPGAAAAWSVQSVTVRPGDSASSELSVKTSASTPPGTYNVTVQGINGSVTRAVPSGLILEVR
jgi:hypothetical protein